ncbi:TPM domain-containing protein [Ralstonia solanacearum]|nr:TPM domain-containing protein [Ralstonia solanacearum]
MNQAARMFRHLKHIVMPHRHVRRPFSGTTLRAIEDAIARCEATHAGQLCFAIESTLGWAALLEGTTPRERALEVFSNLRVWDTEHNNGVLIYVLLADRCVEIVADRGISSRVPAEAWETLCRDMEAAFKAGDFKRGALAGIEAIGRLLSQHFPAPQDGVTELPARPVMLDGGSARR